LTTDTSILTAVGNDLGYEHVFSRQVAALGRPGDALICISTSGASANVIAAARAARACGMTTMGLLGRDGGELRALCDLPLVVPGPETARLQEAHELVLHLVCEALERFHSEATP
jgi:D-sedoheptulose 7-phosphate isomerase